MIESSSIGFGVGVAVGVSSEGTGVGSIVGVATGVGIGVEVEGCIGVSSSEDGDDDISCVEHPMIRPTNKTINNAVVQVGELIFFIYYVLPISIDVFQKGASKDFVSKIIPHNS